MSRPDPYNPSASAIAFAKAVLPPWPPKSLSDTMAHAVRVTYVYDWFAADYEERAEDWEAIFRDNA